MTKHCRFEHFLALWGMTPFSTIICSKTTWESQPFGFTLNLGGRGRNSQGTSFLCTSCLASASSYNSTESLTDNLQYRKWDFSSQHGAWNNQLWSIEPNNIKTVWYSKCRYSTFDDFLPEQKYFWLDIYLFIYLSYIYTFIFPFWKA